ncbi:hypothetical protein [Georgenia sp. AZ-5]|uniref:hypothetical protein n=1 Tax=Georgenia sp. AZ-5 TaxID=3367526 RepID=UPI0037551AC6
MALGTWAVRDAAATTPVYAAAEDLTPGDPIDTGSLVVQEVRLGAPEAHYLRVADGVPARAVAVRPVAAGELVPRSAVGSTEAVDLRPVVIPLGLSVPADLGPGTVVDLWLTPPPPSAATPADGEDPEPVLLAADLVVAEVLEDTSVFTGGTGVSVELLVPRLDLPEVLGALSSDGELVVVPTFGAPGAGAPAEGQG